MLHAIKVLFLGMLILALMCILMYGLLSVLFITWFHYGTVPALGIIAAVLAVLLYCLYSAFHE